MLALAKLILFLIWILYFEQFYELKLSFILLICFTLVYIKFSSNINLFNWPPQQQTPKFDNSRIYLRIKTITDLQAYFFWQANSIYFFTEYLSPSSFKAKIVISWQLGKLSHSQCFCCRHCQFNYRLITRNVW